MLEGSRARCISPWVELRCKAHLRTTSRNTPHRLLRSMRTRIECPKSSECTRMGENHDPRRMPATCVMGGVVDGGWWRVEGGGLMVTGRWWMLSVFACLKKSAVLFKSFGCKKGCFQNKCSNKLHSMCSKTNVQNKSQTNAETDVQQTCPKQMFKTNIQHTYSNTSFKHAVQTIIQMHEFKENVQHKFQTNSKPKCSKKMFNTHVQNM